MLYQLRKPAIWTSSRALMVSIHSTGHSPMHWSYPHTGLNILHSTDGIPLQYRTPFNTLIISPHSTEHPPSADGILYSTDSASNTAGHPLMYWWYSNTVLVIYPHTLMVHPTVQDNLQCTDGIPKQYWTSSTALNTLHSTAQKFPTQCWTSSNESSKIRSELALCLSDLAHIKRKSWQGLY